MESLPVVELHHPPNSPGFLQRFWNLRIVRTQRVTPPTVVFFSFGFGILLARVSSSFPDLSSTELDTGTGEMSLLIASSRSRTGISPTVGEEGEDEEDDSPVS